MAIGSEEFLEAAVASGLIDGTLQNDLATGATRSTAEVVENLSVRGRFPIEALYRAVAQRRGLPYLDVNRCRPAFDLLRRLPSTLVRRAGILPIEADGRGIVVVLGDPDDQQSLDVVHRVLGRPVQAAMAEPAVLERAIERALDHLQPAAAALTERRIDPVDLMDRIMKEAFLRRASDIHLEPIPEGLRVRLRIDGSLHEVMGGLSIEQRAALISRVKVLAELDIAEQRAPQDGGFTYRLPFGEGEEFDIRVATLPTEWGERATMRLLGVETRELDLPSLGMTPGDLGRFRKVIRRPYGMLLLTGPTGSGKTTTLYAALAEINHPEINILTVEDPVEYRISGVSQVHVGGSDKVSFGSALRAFLRHDPDVMMVGEIRDAQTADAAIKAAMTGHLVLSTLHTNYACGAVTRLADIGCEPFLIAATLKGVVAQRLVRRLCPRCKGSRPATAEEAAFLAVEEADVGVPKGCAGCVGTGYRGRIGLFESLWIDRELADLIARRPTENELRAAAGDRLRTLVEDVRPKVLDRIVTVEEARGATMIGD